MNRFTIGIEEEFQIVDRETLQLSPSVSRILPEVQLKPGGFVKAESHCCMIETASGVCRDIKEAGEAVRRLRKSLSEIAEKHNLKLASSGTHPFSSWMNQPVFDNPLFKDMEEKHQEIVRSNLTFGMHVHIGISDREAALQIVNSLRNYLPLLLALSANSPFFLGRNTGYKSYRSIVYNRLPRNGIPEYYESYAQYKEYLSLLEKTRCLPIPGKIWWDARVHPFYETVEVRICDAQTKPEETIAIAALIQALICYLYGEFTKGSKFNNIPTPLIKENRWRAARYGLEGKMADFENKRETGFQDVILELLEILKPISNEMDSSDEFDCLEKMVNQKTGATRQLDIYSKTGDFKKVVESCLI